MSVHTVDATIGLGGGVEAVPGVGRGVAEPLVPRPVSPSKPSATCADGQQPLVHLPAGTVDQLADGVVIDAVVPHGPNRRALGSRAVILSDATIREEMAAGRIVIDPLGAQSVQPSSVDLRLGAASGCSATTRWASSTCAEPSR